ncbi:hypothetical protein [uncultured phage MedDCM-OCT-S04-C148]|nr:hypothetical protein [uncultured phage MedDCM-OCT-S04-C148]
MNLVDFVRSLPKHWATAPIYAKGAVMPNGKKLRVSPRLGVPRTMSYPLS